MDCRPQNVKRYCAFIRWVNSLLHGGAGALKAWCHGVRETLATTFRELNHSTIRHHFGESAEKRARRTRRGFRVTRASLMFASRVNRAVKWKRPIEQTERRALAASVAAIARWTSSAEYDPRALEAVLRHLRKLKVKKYTPEQEVAIPWPTPGAKAVIENLDRTNPAPFTTWLRKWSEDRAQREVILETDALIRESELEPPIQNWTEWYRDDSSSDEEIIGFGMGFGGGSAYYDTMGTFSGGNIGMPTQLMQQSRMIAESEPERLAEKLRTLVPRAADCTTILEVHGPAGYGPPPLTPVAIAEMGDKVRLASTHGTREVWLSRRLNQLWLPTLERVHRTRYSLAGQPVRLLRDRRKGNPRKALVYSADLSAATDYIPHEVGQKIARALNSLVFTDESARTRWNEATDVLLGPHAVTESGDFATILNHSLPTSSSLQEAYERAYEKVRKTVTTRGLHMGLGPSWVILSLINEAAAAIAAPNHPRSAAVCGDDLVALWTPEEVQRYEDTLTALGLVVNRSKSFYGPAGVFCETLVERETPWIATSRVVAGPAEIGASKWKAKVTKSPLSTYRALLNPAGPLPSKFAGQLRSRRLHELRPNNRTGPVEAGGCGKGAASMAQNLHLLKHGNMPLVRDARESWKPTLQAARVRSTAEFEEGVEYAEYEEVRNALLRETRLAGYYDPEKAPVAKTKARSVKQFNREGTMIARFSMEKWLAAIPQSKLGCRDKNTLHWITGKALRVGRFTQQDRRRIQRLLLRPRTQGWIPITVAEEIKKEHALPLRNLGIQPKRRGVPPACTAP
jgi:hypothetical protein